MSPPTLPLRSQGSLITALIAVLPPAKEVKRLLEAQPGSPLSLSEHFACLPRQLRSIGLCVCVCVCAEKECRGLRGDKEERGRLPGESLCIRKLLANPDPADGFCPERNWAPAEAPPTWYTAQEICRRHRHGSVPATSLSGGGREQTGVKSLTTT